MNKFIRNNILFCLAITLGLTAYGITSEMLKNQKERLKSSTLEPVDTLNKSIDISFEESQKKSFDDHVQSGSITPAMLKTVKLRKTKPASKKKLATGAHGISEEMLANVKLKKTKPQSKKQRSYSGRFGITPEMLANKKLKKVEIKTEESKTPRADIRGITPEMLSEVKLKKTPITEKKQEKEVDNISGEGSEEQHIKKDITRDEPTIDTEQKTQEIQDLEALRRKIRATKQQLRLLQIQKQSLKSKKF